MRTAARPALAGDDVVREPPPGADAEGVRGRLARVAASPAGVAAGLVVLVAGSAVIRWELQRAGFWIDEGLTVGLAGHDLADIPRLLRQDGSPPFYYLLLNLWMEAFGTGEVATHALSLAFALVTVPAALWAGWSLFGRRVGWTCAAIAATNPFLTFYGRETRMYTLVALLAIVAAAAFLHAFAQRRRGHLVTFAVALALLLYTHNWGLYFAMGAVVALVPLALATGGDRRGLLRDAALSFGAAGLAYLAWVPTLLYQVAHTGAPWSRAPQLREAVSEVSGVLGDERVLVALLLAGGAGLAPVVLRPRSTEGAEVIALVTLVVVPLGLAWVSSQFEPNWATRYFATVLGPLILVAGLALARAGWQGVAALAMILLFWTHPLARLSGEYESDGLDYKSNVREIAAGLSPQLDGGDLVVSTHAEQVPVLRYYLGDDLRYATPMGPVADPTFMDWRDVVERMERATVERNLAPLVDALDAGDHLALVVPTGGIDPERDAPRWFELYFGRTLEWRDALDNDRRLRVVGQVGDPNNPELSGTTVVAYVYVKTTA